MTDADRASLAAAQRRRARQLRLFEEPEEQAIRALSEAAVDGLSGDEAIALVRRLRGMLRPDEVTGRAGGDAAEGA